MAKLPHHPSNREFIITYMEDLDKGYEKISFRTMKHFSDWFNSRKIKRLLIISISEHEGDARFDKYFYGPEERGESQ